MERLRVRVERKDDHVVVHAAGPMDKTHVDQLKQALEQWQGERAVSKLSLEISQVTLLDSVALGVIIYHYSYLKNSGRQMVLLDPNAEIRELLELSCLDRIIPVETSDRV